MDIFSSWGPRAKLAAFGYGTHAARGPMKFADPWFELTMLADINGQEANALQQIYAAQRFTVLFEQSSIKESRELFAE